MSLAGRCSSMLIAVVLALFLPSCCSAFLIRHAQPAQLERTVLDAHGVDELHVEVVFGFSPKKVQNMCIDVPTERANAALEGRAPSSDAPALAIRDFDEPPRQVAARDREARLSASTREYRLHNCRTDDGAARVDVSVRRGASSYVLVGSVALPKNRTPAHISTPLIVLGAPVMFVFDCIWIPVAMATLGVIAPPGWGID